MKSLNLILSAGLLAGCCNLVLAQENVARQRIAGQMQDRMQERMGQLRELRGSIADYYDAIETGNAAEVEAAKQKVQTNWNQLPLQMRSNIETRHPGTTARVTNLASEVTVNDHTATGQTTITRDEGTMHRDTTITGENGKTITQTADVTKDGNTTVRDGQTTGPNGKIATSHDEVTHDGNTVTREGTTVGPNGGEWKRDDTWTKDKENQTLTHDGTRTTPDGKVVTIDSTATKTEDGFHRDATITGPDGKTIDKDIDVVKDGNTVTRDATVTGPEGKTIENHDTWTKDGDTINHEGQTTGNNGDVKQTRESTLTKEGDTVTRDAHRDNANGSSADAHGQWTKDGNTVTGTNEVTRTRGARQHDTNYADDTDLFGDRKPMARRAIKNEAGPADRPGAAARRAAGAGGGANGGGANGAGGGGRRNR